MWDTLQLLAFSPPGWGGVLLRGLFFTVVVALGAYALGLLIGFFGAVGKIYGGPVLKWSLEIYTTLIRAVPELVLILLLFYAGQDVLNAFLALIGVGRMDINPVVAGIVVLGFVQGAYTTEVIRAAMLSVPKGQVEAAYAYGMSRIKMLGTHHAAVDDPFCHSGSRQSVADCHQGYGATCGGRISRTGNSDACSCGKYPKLSVVLLRRSSALSIADACLNLSFPPTGTPLPARG